MASANTKRTTKKRLLELILDKKNNIFNFSELTLACGVSRTQFYKSEFHNDVDIIESINNNCVAGKRTIKNDWLTSKEFNKQLCWFKLHADKDELERLQSSKNNNSVIDNTSEDSDSVVQYVVNRTVITKNEFEESKEASSKKS